MNLTTKFLHALFEPLLQNDAETVLTILSTADVLGAEAQTALRSYVDDPIGVRKWNLNERVFFVGDDFPVVAKRAMLLLREARVAAAYGLRESAFEILEQTLQMRPDRLSQVARALEVYEMGIMRAREPAEEPHVEEPRVEEVQAPDAPAPPAEELVVLPANFVSAQGPSNATIQLSASQPKSPPRKPSKPAKPSSKTPARPAAPAKKPAAAPAKKPSKVVKPRPKGTSVSSAL